MGRRPNAGKAKKDITNEIVIELEIKKVDELTLNKKKIVKKPIENDK